MVYKKKETSTMPAGYKPPVFTCVACAKGLDGRLVCVPYGSVTKLVERNAALEDEVLKLREHSAKRQADYDMLLRERKVPATVELKLPGTVAMIHLAPSDDGFGFGKV